MAVVVNVELEVGLLLIELQQVSMELALVVLHEM